MDYAKESLRLHGEWKGKIKVVSKIPVANKEDLSLAYTPGVAQPCIEINKDYNKSFELTATLGTKAVDENWTFDVRAPLQYLTKAEIIKKGLELGVDYSITHSCYNPKEDGSPCLKCDSCALRQRAFGELGMKDPAVK